MQAGCGFFLEGLKGNPCFAKRYNVQANVMASVGMPFGGECDVGGAVVQESGEWASEKWG